MTASMRFTAAASATVAILVGCGGESGPTDAGQFDAALAKSGASDGPDALGGGQPSRT